MPFRVNYKVGSFYDGIEDDFEDFDNLQDAQEEAARLIAKKLTGHDINEVVIDEYTRLCGPPEGLIAAEVKKLRDADEADRKRREDTRIKEDLLDISAKAQKVANATGRPVVVQVHPQVIAHEESK